MQPFCRDCTRARLSPDGKPYTCLVPAAGHDLRVLLRQGASSDDLRAALARIWRGRGDRCSQLRGALPVRPAWIELSYIGG
jgi:GTP 3',8-cyclase